LIEADISNLLVIGVDLVSLAVSARRAGYDVYAVDYFGDQDLRRICREVRSIIEQKAGSSSGRFSTNFNPEALIKLTRDLLRRNTVDGALISSGLDDSPDALSELNDMVPIIGNSPQTIRRVRDKMGFFQELEHFRITHPETEIAEDLEEAVRRARDMGYPVVVKPSRGFGGSGISRVRSPRELGRAFLAASALDKTVLIQKFIPGIAASASLISCADEAVTLTLNEQLLGMRRAGQNEPFGYCGNVVPLSVDESVEDRCRSVVERIALCFSLVGSNGVDLVISREGVPYVVEVNPRFQGTLECVERVLGMNMVETHVKACTQGTLPAIAKGISVFCVRLILFYHKRSMVPDLSVFKDVRDVPPPGVIVEDGEPLCSIVVTGASRDSSLEKAWRMAELIYKTL